MKDNMDICNVYKNLTSSLLKILERQTALSLQYDLKSGDGQNSLILESLRNKLVCRMTVIVLGRFATGKSTFISSLCGIDFGVKRKLPWNSITKITYAETPCAVIYPQKTKPEIDNRPFTIDLSDIDYLDRDVSLKMVIKYPVDICQNGIDIVEFPGLDELICHDMITEEYLLSADAIVYCMKAQNAFSAFDKTIIEQLRSQGYKSIIFVLTYFDALEQGDLMTGKHDADETKKYYTKVLKDYTDLGEEGVFFVGSLAALMGKLMNDSNMLESSHLPDMEKKLMQELFSNRGRVRLLKMAYDMKKVNRRIERKLVDDIEDIKNKRLYNESEESVLSNLTCLHERNISLLLELERMMTEINNEIH